MEYILHLDTSGTTGLVMLSEDGKVIAYRRNEAEREHAGTINSMITNVLQEGNVTMNKLSAIAVCSGPGSYTGLRIGLATAKGMCYALNIPLIMQHKLDLLVDNTLNLVTISIIPARAGEYFIAVYDAERNELAPAQHAATEEVIKIAQELKVARLVGNAGEDVISIIKCINTHLMTDINLYFWATVGFLKYKNQQFEDIATAEPLYLKPVYIHKKTF